MLTRVDVTFSEPVAGVDAGSLLINGSPAEGVSGSLAGPYTFEFTQPVSSPVQVSWALNHGIHDLSGRMNALGAGTWSYTLDGSGAQTNVVISEIMYHPSPEMPEPIEREWIELYNKGSVAVNLHGWRLSSGMDFAFTNISIPANGYLVVAANLAAFQAQYPGVQNVVGDWEGKLSNNGDTINLRNALDDVVTSVSYASQGDWGRRLRGRGERQVTSLTRSGTTATATVFGHNMRTGDHVKIYGADQSAYNVQDATITLTSSSTFTYTISGSPATPATGVIICRQLTDQGVNRRGWSWSSLADGLGRSMELINVNMPQKHGQNWAPSAVLYGTPGGPNSVVVANTAPIILDVQHYPLVPRSGETITISARVLDETNRELSAAFYWRNASTTSPGNFTSVQMFDDGAHGDGVANDGIFGASLPPQGNQTVIEFYVGASDMLGNQRTWPAPALDPTDAPIQQANALLQVDDSTYSGTQPFYRIIMTETERAELRANHDAAGDCNATMNATFITIEGAESLLRYNTGIRNRGAGSRTAWPMNYRVGFVNDNRWKGVRSVHLNSQNDLFAGGGSGAWGARANGCRAWAPGAGSGQWRQSRL